MVIKGTQGDPGGDMWGNGRETDFIPAIPATAAQLI
jgi:hypothetical protein